jgi:hypothetical protein
VQAANINSVRARARREWRHLLASQGFPARDAVNVTR